MENEQQRQEMLNKYSLCMQEIKLRTDAIRLIYEKKCTTPFPQTNTEFLCLQLRKILELIAMANLVANKEDYAKIRQKFNTDWNAKRILEQIKKINTNFFPRGIIRNISSDTIAKFDWIEKTDYVLTEEIYADIYDEISNILHAQNPFNENNINLNELNTKISIFMTLIVNLLNEHTVCLCNGDKINCLMNAIEEGKDPNTGKVSVFYFQKLPQPSQVQK